MCGSGLIFLVRHFFSVISEYCRNLYFKFFKIFINLTSFVYLL